MESNVAVLLKQVEGIGQTLTDEMLLVIVNDMGGGVAVLRVQQRMPQPPEFGGGDIPLFSSWLLNKSASEFEEEEDHLAMLSARHVFNQLAGW
mmetsp:Transcript_7853/g.18464  ORF Transcript_7853/g.18464 Transcript_7853/m.18464 type:complete len:93 (+) Transcript_7853:197-475(+)